MSAENLVQINSKKRFTSRSAVLCAKTCMYKRFLSYHLGGSGYVNEKESLDLLIGTCVHRGLQHLLEHCRTEHPNGDYDEGCVDNAVEEARKVWTKTLTKKSLWLHSGEEDRLEWIIAEQEVLFEGLIRAWAIHKLPWILKEYEILEVEHEEVFEDFSSMVIFLGKADGLFRRRSDNALIILSIKTTSEFAEVTTRDILHDMQGVSEWVIVQDRINKAWKRWEEILLGSDFYGLVLEDYSEDTQKFIAQYQWMKNYTETPEVFAVQYEYLIKGKRRQDPQYSGIYKQFSFLCHPTKKEGMQRIFIGSGGSVVNSDEYKWKLGKGKQPKGWEKIDIWNDIGIKNWIEMLATGQVQPEEGHPFDHILVTPDLVRRGEEEIKEWLVSTSFSEEEIVEHLQELETYYEKASQPEIYNLDEVMEVLQNLVWRYFPKNTQNCHDYYGKDCQYVFHCHEMTTVEEAVDAGMLIRRSSHHEAEAEYLKEEGLSDE